MILDKIYDSLEVNQLLLLVWFYTLAAGTIPPANSL
jgi:hypothetical protein